MVKIDDYKNDVPVQWCPGCPNFGILNALKTALTALGKQPHEYCLVSGIGQAAKLPHYLKCNFFNGLHGRAFRRPWASMWPIHT
jgi:2-oxoglutarate ferredoxin oxidoreductase subunit beta